MQRYYEKERTASEKRQMLDEMRETNKKLAYEKAKQKAKEMQMVKVQLNNIWQYLIGRKYEARRAKKDALFGEAGEIGRKRKVVGRKGKRRAAQKKVLRAL